MPRKTNPRFGWTIYRPDTGEVIARDRDREKVSLRVLRANGLTACPDWEFDQCAHAEISAATMRAFRRRHGLK